MPPAEPLPPNLPHIAIVLLWYPLFTQPFIFREVENLSLIMPVEVYTLYGDNPRHLSEEMRHSRVFRHTYGSRRFFGICWEMLKYAFFHPAQFAHLLKRSLWHKWPNIEVFGENLWAFAMGFTLGQRFLEDGIDFVYAPWPRGAATAAWVGATIAGIPFGIAARGDNLEPPDPDLAAKLRSATLIRANNLADKKRIENFDQHQALGKTELVYNSLTLPLPSQTGTRSLPLSPVKLLALGRFDVTKGFDVLLRACAILKKRRIPFTLTLAGGGGKIMGLGSQEKKLQDLRKSLGLEHEVSMPGLVSHDELPTILANHDIFVAPCIVHHTGRRDGIPNTVIEALAYGMPVISTNVNALPEVVRHAETGLVIPPNDPEALAEAIMEMLHHPEEAGAFGKNGARLAKELFDPVENALQLKNMFIQASSKCAA